MSVNFAPFCLPHLPRVYYLLLAIIIMAGLLNSGYAQSVHPSIHLDQPSELSTNGLGVWQKHEEPTIGLYLSREASTGDSSHQKRIEDTIQQWEFFLVGLQLPYVLISDSLFDQNINNYLDILIVPNPESLADSSLNILQNFVDQGGGVIASGYSGHTARSEEAISHVKELAGIEELIPVEGRTGRIRQKLMGRHQIGKNIPIGFEFDLFSSRTTFVAEMGEGKSVGHAMIAGKQQSYTCIATNEYGLGRVAWMGFGPQDVPPNEIQQQRYQELVIDALVYVSKVAYASVRRWPNGYQSAVSFAQLPSSGYQPFSYRTSTDLLLSAFDVHDVSPTFFVVLQHAKDHPDLLKRMRNRGAFGLVSDSPKPLSGLAEEIQHERLSVSKWYLEGEYGQKLLGALPPGYFYDSNTLRALMGLGIQYILSDAKHFQEPVPVVWDEELDYRDPLLSRAPSDSILMYHEPSQLSPLIRLYPTLFSYDLDAPLTKGEEQELKDVSYQGRWAHRLKNGFEQVHEKGGLFALGYEPEVMGLTEQRARILQSFIGSLRGRNTWYATLNEVVEWWGQRTQVILSLQESTPTRTVFMIENRGEEAIQGVSIDVFVPEMDMAQAEFKSGELSVSVGTPSGQMHLVQIENLPKGKHIIGWHVDGDGKASDEIDP